MDRETNREIKTGRIKVDSPYKMEKMKLTKYDGRVVRTTKHYIIYPCSEGWPTNYQPGHHKIYHSRYQATKAALRLKPATYIEEVICRYDENTNELIYARGGKLWGTDGEMD